MRILVLNKIGNVLKCQKKVELEIQVIKKDGLKNTCRFPVSYSFSFNSYMEKRRQSFGPTQGAESQLAYLKLGFMIGQDTPSGKGELRKKKAIRWEKAKKLVNPRPDSQVR